MMELQKLLRILDHPQAADIIQKMLCSRPKGTTPQKQARNQDGVSIAACSHCSVMFDVMSADLLDQNDNTLSVEWTPHTLQQIVNLGSLTGESSSFLNDMSSRAMYTLLILLEWNVSILSIDSLCQFIRNIEKLPFVSSDGWSEFLIQRLKKVAGLVSVGNAEQLSLAPSPHGNIVEMQNLDDSTTVVSPTPVEVMDTPEEVMETPPTSAPLDADALPEANIYKLKMAKVYQEWLASKVADQQDFDSLCSLSHEEFQRSLCQFEEQHLPESAITAINTNISSLPSEMSYHNAISFIHAILYPMVVALKQSASRAVTSVVCSINSAYPDPMVHGFIIPMLQHHSFGASHGNLLVKMLEESSTKEQLDSIWGKFLDIEVDNNGDMHYWNDHMTLVALTLLKKKVSLNEASTGRLVNLLQRNAEPLSKSSKFAKLIMELCKSLQYQKMMSSYLSELSEVAASHKSISKSSIQREISKLSSTIS